MLTIDQIHNATGCKRENIEAHWPAIVEALKKQGIHTELTEKAVVATIATETPNFEPITEMGKRAYFDRYDRRMGNSEPGEGYKYRGRGLIQITGKNNYRKYGRYLGIPLEEDPDRALDPTVSAQILAAYFQLAWVAKAADAKDWRKVRVRVNGGTNGWDRFSDVLRKLGESPCE